MSKQNPDLLETDLNAVFNADEIPEIFRGQKFLDPRYNPAFGAFFSDEEVLTDFLNSLLRLNPGRRIQKLDFTVQYPLEFRVPEMNSVIFDIHAVTEDQRYLDIEMQRAKHSFFKDRILLYGSYLVIKGKQQMNDSEMFANFDEAERKRRRYEIPETICIWLCDFHPTENFVGYRDTWAIYSENDLAAGRRVAISEKMKYLLVDLQNFVKERKTADTREEKWLYLLANAGKNNEISDFDDEIYSKALERIRVSAANIELLRKQAKDMVTQDEIDARIGEAIVNSRTEGCAEGALSKARAMAKAMLAEGDSIEKIVRISGLSKEAILAL